MLARTTATTSTASKILLGFLHKKVSPSLLRRYAKMQIASLQEEALEEQCILVSESDKAIGHASKRVCHTITSNGDLPLHRAFSVFLFNASGDLLLQKRSATKITFPGCYTNTCCSHPLGEIYGETVEQDALGIRRAAVRRLGYELGIPPRQIQPHDFLYLTRIHYKAAGDDCWGEHEIDYILFVQKDDVILDPNPDEVSEIKWVSRKDIDAFAKETDAPLTPWFRLLLRHKLTLWWDNLQRLEEFQDHSNIQRFL